MRLWAHKHWNQLIAPVVRQNSSPREINNIATAISPPLDRRCHIATLVFRERLLEETEFSIATR
jgi:hypothetical protein